LLIVPLLAHKRPHSDGKEEDHHSKDGVCHYKSTAGVDYDLRLLESWAIVDYQFFDSTTRNTFYFRPCGNVKTSGCDPQSAVCMVNSAGKAVSYGSLAVQWADGAENGASIEGIYGNGEQCGSGARRKTIIEYVCNPQASSGIVSGTFDDCTAQFVVESPFVCPVANYCSSVVTADTCDSSQGLCKWENGQCAVVSTSCLWRHLSHSSGLFVIIMLASTGALLTCTLCLCVCACRRRRRCNRARLNRRVCKKASRKSAKVEKKQNKTSKKVDEVEYAPFQMPFQLVPGGFAPINPYSNIQGYPLVTFVAPEQEPEQV